MKEAKERQGYEGGISAKEPPTHGEPVLIWWQTVSNFDKPRAFIGEYNVTLKYWRPLGCNGNYDDQVTHWMPLPKKP